MRRLTRAAFSGAAALALAAGLLAVGTATGAPPEPDVSATPDRPAVDTAAEQIVAFQERLARTPGDYVTWSELGFAYLEQARRDADPSLYDRAEGAFDKALALRQDDTGAVTGKAALAAARHEFAEALALTDRALANNTFDPTTYAVRTDALLELGRYDEAVTTVRRLLELQPAGVDSLARASYVQELRGEQAAARTLLQRAADTAATPADTAFAQYYLGELAWHSGDLDVALGAYGAGLAADPTFLPLVAGRAKVLAARGQIDEATTDYRRVVEKLPQPEFVVALGELLEASGDARAAEDQYAVARATQQLFAANGQDVDTELALFEADHGSPAAAVTAAQKAHAKRPQSIFTQDAYAWALHRAGRSREALPLAQAATRTGLASPALLARVGTIEAAAGEAAAARATLTRALELNPHFSPLHAPKAAALLASLR